MNTRSVEIEQRLGVRHDRRVRARAASHSSGTSTRTGPYDAMCSHIVDEPGPPFHTNVTGRLRAFGAVERVRDGEHLRGLVPVRVVQRHRSGARGVGQRAPADRRPYGASPRRTPVAPGRRRIGAVTLRPAARTPPGSAMPAARTRPRAARGRMRDRRAAAQTTCPAGPAISAFSRRPPFGVALPRVPRSASTA